MLLQVAIPVPLYKIFDYLPIHQNQPLPSIGTRVQVPFANQKLVGIVVGFISKKDSTVPTDKLKSIIEVLDDEPLIDKQFLQFAYWLSDYYHYPLGETLAVMLPVLLRQGEQIVKNQRVYVMHPDATNDFVTSAINKTAKKQLADIAIFKHHPHSTKAQLKALGVSEQNFKIFLQKNLIIEIDEKPVHLPKPPPDMTLKEQPLTLNDEQQYAFDAIVGAIDSQAYSPILLNGVTGSGKTEVYLQSMQRVLERGKQVLMLVPEIGLTPQSMARFAQRFCANIVVLHSGLNDNERLAGWLACRNGEAQLVIATRSAIFYPFANLGLIVVDEAHDGSFKQQDHLRYQACDVAMMLAKTHKIPVVFGTATPSLTHLKLVADGKLAEYRLSKRAGRALPPKFELVDLRLGRFYQNDMAGQEQNTELAPKTVQAIRDTLARGEQVLVFLNRRGYAPILLCSACGWQADCIRCSSHLTLHKNNFKKSAKAPSLYDYLKCHHCGYQINTPTHCPECHSQNLVSLGQGTSQLFERLHSIFANPQHSSQIYPILQIDRDTVRSKGAWDRLYDKINTNEPMILVGTQMLAKGHHFAGVTLVVVVDADSGFLSPDFRSPEVTAQTILQVAGRAGRDGRQGLVMVQTYKPDSAMLQRLMNEGYESFAKSLLDERRLLGLPPYTHAALVRADAPSLERARLAIMTAKDAMAHPNPFAVLAPIEAPMLKKNNRYHVQMLILTKDRMALHQMLNTWWYGLINANLPALKGVRLSIDIDPQGW